MALNYSQTLIARPKDFVPSGTQVQMFFSKLIAMGAIPGDPQITMLRPTGKFRRIRNPFTREIDEFGMYLRRPLRTMDMIARAVGAYRNYEMVAAGTGKPKLPPLPLDAKEPYAMTVSCHVSARVLSTSDLHGDSEVDRKIASFGLPARSRSNTGYFTNPHDFSPIKVPHAGAARFWVRFELGKFLFPAIENSNLQLLHPKIVTLARKVFGVEFAQGCYWV